MKKTIKILVIIIFASIPQVLFADNDLDSLLQIVETQLALNATAPDEGEYVFDFAEEELGESLLNTETMQEVNTFAQELVAKENKEVVVLLLPAHPINPEDADIDIEAIFLERAQIVLDKIGNKENRTILIYQIILTSEEAKYKWIVINPNNLGITKVAKGQRNENRELRHMLGLINSESLELISSVGKILALPPIYRDKDGNIVYITDGTQGEFPHATGETTTFEIGYIFADDGTPIQVYKNLDNNKKGFDTNCHGTTFADGEFWIDPYQIPNIFDGEGYQQVQIDDLQECDVVIYLQTVTYDDGYSELSPEHSAMVIKSDGTIEGTQVIGLGGVNIDKEIDNIMDAWEYAETYILARKTTKDKVVSDEEIEQLRQQLYPEDE